ncbi:geranylgeranyl reductase family protein [Corynebacterium sp. 13CS0277]|uniref:geranylgeranyl reductase family protein n=1 Tax=Corynebacterium sp. 13CS0277 TaxID=2071994 RepID=UPI001E3A7FB3|nr:geranylgeranyl reductase family protein [Corynebacterium sp. 13CS0277]
MPIQPPVDPAAHPTPDSPQSPAHTATGTEARTSADAAAIPTAAGAGGHVLVVGAGPAGSAAALRAARAGFTVTLVDQAEFPRDKTCGDGLTPRAMHALEELGFGAEIGDGFRTQGLKLFGFGGEVTCPWGDSAFGAYGSAMRRTRFDALLVERAAAHPAVTFLPGRKVLRPEFAGARISALVLQEQDGAERRLPVTHVLVADGVRSTLGKQLGRVWHKEHVYGIAARSYCRTPRSGEPWIHSHLELRDAAGDTHPGYGWVFPLGPSEGYANVGCGALSTLARPSHINTKKVLAHYASSLAADWGFSSPEHVASALLPMGGAVSNVAGPNWMLLGDAAACVNPLNGEGIDYALETARHAVDILAQQPRADYTLLWPDVLRAHYGAAFSLARSLARLLTVDSFLPRTGPLALRGPQASIVMPAAARLMGNLVTEEDRDLVARAWRAAGHRTARGPQLWDSTGA